jgi:phenylalanyl-tRNA synthetase alpha chain
MMKLNKQKFEEIKQQCLEKLKTADTIEKINEIKIKYLGKKGELKKLLHQISILPIEEKKVLGEIFNNIRDYIEEEIQKKLQEIKLKENRSCQYSRLELTLPAARFSVGKKHPLQRVYDEIKEVFISLGFDVEEGPEVEFEDYNFTLLNIPYDHPARDMQDTLYLSLPETDKGKMLLRTHTSPVQIRVMLTKKLPIKAIMPGRVYRHENLDAAHLFNFHQVEGLMVDKNVTLPDLKGVLIYFVKSIFGSDINFRFRQSYFPFTEPSLEMDIQCLVCRGKGCSVCKNSGFVEVLGCGMVHPQVLSNVGINYEEYTGFAFGLGIERIAMLKFRIDDIRLFYENDIRFITQF